MKLHCANYKSPISKEGMFENVYIQDYFHSIDYDLNIFLIKFKMYYFDNGEEEIIDYPEVSFRGTNEDLKNGLPTTNKTSYIKIIDFVFDDSIPQFVESVNDEGEKIAVQNPFYIPENGVISLIKYLFISGGQLPEKYEVTEWGKATQEDALKYFDGGTLNSPQLFVSNPFARGWILNNIQAKGQAITNFEFMD